MTLSAPSFFAAATRASRPPPAATEVVLDQSVLDPLPVEVDELELPQAVAASATPAASEASLVTRFISGCLFSLVRYRTWSGAGAAEWGAGPRCLAGVSRRPLRAGRGRG